MSNITPRDGELLNLADPARLSFAPREHSRHSNLGTPTDDPFSAA
jgi:hypothetical protein